MWLKRNPTNKQEKKKRGKKARRFFFVHPQDTIASFVQDSEILQPATSAATAA